MNRKTGAIIAIVTAIHALSPLAMQIFVPALPAISSSFSATVADTQWVVTAFSVALAVSMLAYGPVSDRYGRRLQRDRVLASHGRWSRLSAHRLVTKRHSGSDDLAYLHLRACSRDRRCYHFPQTPPRINRLTVPTSLGTRPGWPRRELEALVPRGIIPQLWGSPGCRRPQHVLQPCRPA